MMKKTSVLTVTLLLGACGGGGDSGVDLSTPIDGPSSSLLVVDQVGGVLKRIDLQSGGSTTVTAFGGFAGEQIILSGDKQTAYVAAGDVRRIAVATGETEKITDEQTANLTAIGLFESGELYWYSNEVEFGANGARRHGGLTYFSPESGQAGPFEVPNEYCGMARIPNEDVFVAAEEPNPASGYVNFSIQTRNEQFPNRLATVATFGYPDSYRCFVIDVLPNGNQLVVYGVGGSRDSIEVVPLDGSPVTPQVVEVPGLAENESFRFIAAEEGGETVLVTTRDALYRVELSTGRAFRMYTAEDLGVQEFADLAIVQ